MWLAPNMVTLIGFFFVLANIGLLVIFMPDLVGPVGRFYNERWWIGWTLTRHM